MLPGIPGQEYHDPFLIGGQLHLSGRRKLLTCPQFGQSSTIQASDLHVCETPQEVLWDPEGLEKLRGSHLCSRCFPGCSPGLGVH